MPTKAKPSREIGLTGRVLCFACYSGFAGQAWEGLKSDDNLNPCGLERAYIVSDVTKCRFH